MNYASNVLPLFTLFLCQYRIRSKPFLHFINCFCDINLLFLFQATIGPCKLTCLEKLRKEIFKRSVQHVHPHHVNIPTGQYIHTHLHSSEDQFIIFMFCGSSTQSIFSLPGFVKKSCRLLNTLVEHTC